VLGIIAHGLPQEKLECTLSFLRFAIRKCLLAASKRAKFDLFLSVLFKLHDTDNDGKLDRAEVSEVFLYFSVIADWKKTGGEAPRVLKASY
jgi:hypothetical protein